MKEQPADQSIIKVSAALRGPLRSVLSTHELRPPRRETKPAALRKLHDGNAPSLNWVMAPPHRLHFNVDVFTSSNQKPVHEIKDGVFQLMAAASVCTRTVTKGPEKT